MPVKVRDSACSDVQTMCLQWARAGECEINQKFMEKACPVSCGKCVPNVQGQAFQGGRTLLPLHNYVPLTSLPRDIHGEASRPDAELHATKYGSTSNIGRTLSLPIIVSII